MGVHCTHVDRIIFANKIEVIFMYFFLNEVIFMYCNWVGSEYIQIVYTAPFGIPDGCSSAAKGR